MDSTVASNVMLSLECLEGLEELSAAIRRRNGALFTRSKLIRAIVAGVVAGKMDFSRCRTEEELAGVLSFVIDAFSNRALDSPSLDSPAAPHGSAPVSAPSATSKSEAAASVLRKGAPLRASDFERTLSGARRWPNSRLR